MVQFQGGLSSTLDETRRAVSDPMAWMCSHTKSRLPAHLLGLVYKVVRLIPVSQEVCCLLVIHSDIVICEQTGEKIINFPGHIQNVVDAVENKKKNEAELPWS